MLVDATQRKANMSLCPSKNQVAHGVRYGLTFSTRGHDSMCWMKDREVSVTPKNMVHTVCLLPLSVHPLLWQYTISRESRKHLLGKINICTWLSCESRVAVEVVLQKQKCDSHKTNDSEMWWQWPRAVSFAAQDLVWSKHRNTCVGKFQSFIAVTF